jgi:hypothetical protein
VELLGERGIGTTEDHGDWLGEGGDARAAWETFQAMANEPVNEPFEKGGELVHVHYDDDDLLLFEAGLEYFGMNTVTLQVEFPPTDELRALPDAQIWGSPTALEEWVAKVEASPAFTAFTAAEPIRFYAVQSDI